MVFRQENNEVRGCGLDLLAVLLPNTTRPYVALALGPGSHLPWVIPLRRSAHRAGISPDAPKLLGSVSNTGIPLANPTPGSASWRRDRGYPVVEGGS